MDFVKSWVRDIKMLYCDDVGEVLLLFCEQFIYLVKEDVVDQMFIKWWWSFFDVIIVWYFGVFGLVFCRVYEDSNII